MEFYIPFDTSNEVSLRYHEIRVFSNKIRLILAMIDEQVKF